ncbi:hypothetical protein FEM48_Zijuj01G0108200 [Ziziphus jujuba var. spinosa]|uniref:ATP-dependent Clp protease proteolytic subunit n=1 Tax=Ziziphus jujuba var. spinosa TaxID=714518 RepID=A0A978W0U3_ZIZJJ|nr:hypothetical protein FEM48_Zijuj01G0108200 [Ziziphus jujuba var. spinosa]
MDVLSISSPSHSYIPSLRLHHSSRPKPSFYIPISSSPKPSITKCFQATASPTPTPSSKSHTFLDSSVLSSAPQTPATAMRGAEADAMGLLLRERIVFLGSSIDDFVADAIISQLLLLDAQDSTKDIKLFINSVGGMGYSEGVLAVIDNYRGSWSAYGICATMAIYDVVQLVRADVSTVALGMAASTASIILGGGTKGKRLAMPNTRIMMHQPLGGASGQAMDVEIQAREIMHNKNNVTRIIADCTGRPFEQVLKDIDRDRYMSPIEAVEYGMIDGVIDRDSIIPLMPVPEKVKGRLNYEEISKDPRKFLTPDVPDDEIY